MSTVHFKRISNVALLTLDHEPVNGLGLALRKALMHAFRQACEDTKVFSIVLIGQGRMFSAGADISEFGKVQSQTPPLLPEVINLIEDSKKPVVAAIHGNALGGGLELALGCSYRIATTNANLGLPEVSLGIIPGAGGTQRLPRVIGIPAALDMITTGKPIAAKKAKTLGLVDAITEANLADFAVQFCENSGQGPRALRPSRSRQDKLKLDSQNLELFKSFSISMQRRARNLEAPYAALECVKQTLVADFESGIEFERNTFKKLVESQQSEALRFIFFAERQAAKIDGLSFDKNTQPIKEAAVIGCGTMGGGIAMNFANAGIPVTVLETDKNRLKNGIEIINNNYAASVFKGRISKGQMENCISLINGTTKYEALNDPDIVIEAIFEDMTEKKEVFAELDRVCPSKTILATNTSTLDIDEIASATTRPDKVIGTHFFSPANVMRLQENVRGNKTSDGTIASVMKLAKTLGKVGVLVGVCDGFVGNRMLYAYTRQANFLLEEGALPEQVDKAIYDFGFPMGPFAMGDLAGLDVGWAVRKMRSELRPNNLRYSYIADRICEKGRFGQKTSAGWYKYDKGSRVPLPDPEIHELIIEVSKELGYSRRNINGTEIIERCIFPLINEGAKILSEGIAQRPGDIDTVWIHGYWFPRHLGGPMFYANTIGLNKVYDAMSALYDQHGEWLKPSDLLSDLAATGKGFGDI